MKEQLAKIRAAALEAIADSNAAAALDSVRVKYLGKKGELTSVLKQMGKLSAEERPVIGQIANEVRETLTKAIADQQSKLAEKALEAKLASETLDVSIPGIKPRQIEFSRLGINYTVMSKRKLRQLVEEHRVSGWDDPRMPTLCGLRRRGYTAKSIRNFCERIGVSKVDSTVDWALLESCLRDDLNENAKRVMAVLHPVKLIVTNYPEGKSELLTVENNPLRPEDGTREISFSRELWIEADDFMEVPAPKYKRMHPGFEVRLKGAYLVTCTGCKKDADGSVTEIYCEYDPESRGGDPADGRKVKGATIHWVDANTAVDAEVRLYDYLFSDPEPDGPDKNFLDCINPDSLKVLTGCKVEAGLGKLAMPEKGKDSESFQFMRQGYFCLDNRDATPEHLVFNRAVALKDSFKK